MAELQQLKLRYENMFDQFNIQFDTGYIKGEIIVRDGGCMAIGSVISYEYGEDDTMYHVPMIRSYIDGDLINDVTVHHAESSNPRTTIKRLCQDLERYYDAKMRSDTTLRNHIIEQ